MRVKGKRTYATVLAWLLYHLLKSKGIIVPEELIGPLGDMLVNIIFAGLAALFRAKANKK